MNYVFKLLFFDGDTLRDVLIIEEGNLPISNEKLKQKFDELYKNHYKSFQKFSKDKIKLINFDINLNQPTNQKIYTVSSTYSAYINVDKNNYRNGINLVDPFLNIELEIFERKV